MRRRFTDWVPSSGLRAQSSSVDPEKCDGRMLSKLGFWKPWGRQTRRPGSVGQVLAGRLNGDGCGGNEVWRELLGLGKKKRKKRKEKKKKPRRRSQNARGIRRDFQDAI